MKLGQMITLVNIYIDDVADNDEIVLLLNAGKDNMALELKARFPDIVLTSQLDSTFIFDAEYHEIPVLYAAGMIKSQDSSIREKDSYLMQYAQGLKNFTENYDPPAQYRNDPQSQQFKATAAQVNFTVTKNDFDPVYGNLKVYVNSTTVEFVNNGDKTFSLIVPATLNDAVTAVWELHADFSYPPAYFPGW